MKISILLFSLLLSMAFHQTAVAGQQLELPLRHPDKTLLSAYPGKTNVHLMDYAQLPEKIQNALQEVELAFEMGDGYYDSKAAACYVVVDAAGNAVGYMQVELLSYTEDPEYVLAAAYINLQGHRLEADLAINAFSRDNAQQLALLPSELQPQE